MAKLNKNILRTPRAKKINRFWGNAKRLEFPGVRGKKNK